MERTLLESLPLGFDQSTLRDVRDPLSVIGVASVVLPTGSVVSSVVWLLPWSEAARSEFGLGWVMPLVLIVVAAYAVWWMLTRDLEGHHRARIGLWFVVGGVGFGGSAVLMTVVQPMMGGRIADPGLTAINWGTGGAIAGLVVGRYDVAHLLALREATEARTETERLNERLTVLNRVLRHDIRNDLNVVRGNAGILLATDDYDEDRLREIHRKSDELLTLSERARELESLLGGGTARTSVDLAAAARERASVVDEAFPGVTVETDVPETALALAHDDVPDGVGELIENAAAHNDAPDSRVSVSVSQIADADRLDEGAGDPSDGLLDEVGDLTDDPSQDTTPGIVECRIEDNGPGIPGRELDVLRNSRETQMEHSLGIGLWLAHGTVRASAGSMEFETPEDGGTVVTIRFDAAPDDEEWSYSSASV